MLETDTIKQEEMKEKKKKVNLRRTRKLLETKLYWRNLIKGSCPPSKILGTNLKIEGRTQTNGPEDKKIN